MRHVFRATKMGWGKEKEGIYFDAKYYTKEEAIAEFKPFQGTTQKGYPYTGYEYDGQKYHDVTYGGLGFAPDMRLDIQTLCLQNDVPAGDG